MTTAPTDAVEAVARAIYEADDPWSRAFPWEDGPDDQVRRDAHRAIARAAMAAMPPALPKQGWGPIAEAPRDGTEFWALTDAPPGDDLPPFVSLCAWHADAGFCTDEIRFPILWRHKTAPPESVEP